MRELHLAQAWAAAGQIQRSLMSLRQLVTEQPDFTDAWRLLGDLHLRSDDWAAASAAYDEVLRTHAADWEVRARRDFCLESLDLRKADEALRSYTHGHLDLRGQKRFSSHRSGWNFALEALAPLHNQEGLGFDGFLERHFTWKSGPANSSGQLDSWKKQGLLAMKATSQERGLIPYRRPWVGFVHNPPDMPESVLPETRPQALLRHPAFQESLAFCQGLFTLSDYLSDWLRQESGLRVWTMRFPTEIPPIVFNAEQFLSNPSKKIVQIGWWLRRLNSIYRLPITSLYEKVWLVTKPFAGAREFFEGLRLQEPPALERYAANTHEVDQLPPDDYDRLLSENVAFLDLYDASANCAIVECMARATPILVNPLPAVVEYLGVDYPLYFSSLEEAAEKAMDLELVVRTHQYLRRPDVRVHLSAESFRESVLRALS